jgi:type IV secretion system protein VirB5
MANSTGRMVRIAGAAALVCVANASHAGIPTYDAIDDMNSKLAMVQFLEEVANQITQIGHQITQIEHLQNTFRNMSGSRMLGGLLRNAGLNNYVPLDAMQKIANVTQHGYDGLTPAAKALRDAAMIYNCADLPDSTRRLCESQLAQPYQGKSLLDQAMDTASGRMAHIGQLTDAINDTDDQAAKLEIGARIGAEQAMLQQEQARVLLLGQQLEAQRRIEEAQRRERTAQMIRNRVSIADFMNPEVAP